MYVSDWTRFLLPLPQEFAVHGSRLCHPGSVRVQAIGNDVCIRRGAEALRKAIGARRNPSESLRQPSGTLLSTEGTTATDSVAMRIEVGTYARLVDRYPLQNLDHLPNASQAYQIKTVPCQHIIIAGNQPQGAFYGALTLAQLLAAPLHGERLEVPLIDVVDWPDIEQRGLWNFPDPENWIEWMASMKLNYGKMADTRLTPVRRGRVNTATIDTRLMQHARSFGFDYLPFIVHLNFLHDVGIYQAYPQLAGHGDGALAGRYAAHKQGDPHRAPCASEPVLVDILSQWMASIASQGAEEISGWLSERPCQCQCPRCTPVGQFLLETRAFVSAWRAQHGRYRQLRLRIFSSTTTPEQDDLILAELPPQVRFERACASRMERTRHRPRDLFTNPLLDTAAAGGRWIASYDVPIGAFGNVDTPEVKVPQFGAQRIRDYVTQLHRRKYAGAYGMLAWATQARAVCGFAIAALAEFAWNGMGRGVKAFATAWATREGLPHPVAVGRWAEILGDIEFDIYTSDFPGAYTQGTMAAMIEAGQAPRFGEGLFTHFRHVADFDTAKARCRQARALLTPDCHTDLLLATDVVASYVDLSAALWQVAHLRAYSDLDERQSQRPLTVAIDVLALAGTANIDAIAAWRRHLGPEPWHHRVTDATAATQDTVRRITDHIRHHQSR